MKQNSIILPPQSTADVLTKALSPALHCQGKKQQQQQQAQCNARVIASTACVTRLAPLQSAHKAGEQPVMSEPEPKDQSGELIDPLPGH